ncbi:subtilisin-like protease [Pyrus ussuriensis x Pyrus communis]|uniref:Subtilisin-like protease n=1 Tax=Pyrus ussuriensis x Pyrus communis TaxID=2448454 RepID=A0A5N5GY18_9ROSA|nr:subtilisin-like protease [Pyrus ussuriensis x Pyrus communis]
MRMSLFILPVALALLLLSHISASIEDEREQQMQKTYIIHMDKSNMPASFKDDHSQWYSTSLKQVSNLAYMLYIYTNSGNGGADPKLATSVKTLVEPKSLSFSQANEKKTYTVTVVTSAMASGTDICSPGMVRWETHSEYAHCYQLVLTLATFLNLIYLQIMGDGSSSAEP